MPPRLRADTCRVIWLPIERHDGTQGWCCAETGEVVDTFSAADLARQYEPLWRRMLTDLGDGTFRRMNAEQLAHLDAASTPRTLPPSILREMNERQAG